MRINHTLKAEILNSWLTISEMEQLISEAKALGFTEADRICVEYHQADTRDPRERDWMHLSIRKAP